MSFGQRGGYGSRGGFGRSFVSPKKPVEVGKEYNVTISDTSRRGEGIAKVEGFVVFVPGTKQGQNVRIRVTQVSDRYATGQVIEVPATATAPASEYTQTTAQR
jgi:predicted RNA-binding protein with TRAM domain